MFKNFTIIFSLLALAPTFFSQTKHAILVGASSILPCVGSQMDFQFFCNRMITPTVNLGPAMDVWNQGDVHFLLGRGLRFKAFPYLGLTTGLSFTRMQVLND